MSLNNSNNKKQQQQQEPVYEVSGVTSAPPPSTPLFAPIQQQQQQPQLSPLGRRNIVKVDPNSVRQAFREKNIIPTKQMSDRETLEVTAKQERVNNYVLLLTKDLKGGSLQFATPYEVDEYFQILLSTLADRFSSLASDEVHKKLTEINSLIASDANYDEIIAKLNEAHDLVIALLLALERSILEIAGVSKAKLRVEMLAPLETAQTLGITPISTDRL